MDVIFDANTYRSLAMGRSCGEVIDLVRAIRQAENRRGIFAWAVPTVWSELFNRVVDAADPGFEECLGATVASYAHTRVFGAGRSYRLAPTADAVALETLFGFKDADDDEILKALDRLASVVYFDPVAKVIGQHREQLQAYSNFLQKEERSFVERSKGLAGIYRRKYGGQADLVKKMRRDGVLREMMKEFVLTQAARIGRDMGTLMESEIDELARKAAKFFPAPFQFHLPMIARLMEHPDADIAEKNGPHWYLDYQLLFYISDTAMTLITDDKDIKRAAIAAKVAHKIRSLQEYCDELGIALASIDSGGGQDCSRPGLAPSRGRK